MANGLWIWAQLPGGGGAPGTLLFIGGLFAIMYFVMIRPQQKQLKAQQALIGSLKKGDDVVTQSGFLGKIYAVTDKIVTLEIANGVRVRVLKSSISARTGGEEEVPAKAGIEEKKEEK